ncbi:MAG: hypothetical protein JWL76_848 [Thermoleophilia bacterium]|nr:hypothetical protein [Thermoleophilia bacterium]
MASVDKTSHGAAGAQWRRTEVRSAEVRRDSAQRDEDRAARRVEDAERDLERARDRFDRYA